MPAPKIIIEKVEQFDNNYADCMKPAFNEEQARIEYINPLFKALGWDVDNSAGYAEQYKDVLHEAALKVGGSSKAPDYSFRIGGTRKFFLEAKRPGNNIETDFDACFQLRSYSYTASLPLAVLTNFRHLAIYDGKVEPQRKDGPNKALLHRWSFRDYVDKWDEIEALLGRESVLKGAFDRFAAAKTRKGVVSFDVAFLNDIESWRASLATQIATKNTLSVEELNFAVGRIIDRIIFLRICEERGIEPGFPLAALKGGGGNTYPRLVELFYKADTRYNSGLFHFDPKEKLHENADVLTPALKIENKALTEILKRLYYPETSYAWDYIPLEILGQIYERFLGKVIVLKGKKAEVEPKPEVRKAGGVYYTPSYIVDYIVEQTIGPLLEGKNPQSAAKIKILDPACGSGSFLLGAYTYLLNWHLDWYQNNDPTSHAKKKNPPIFEAQSADPTAKGPVYRLTSNERKRILRDNLFGVDIDRQAVEVTKLSLLLKVLEGETDESISNTLKLFHERALPDLGDNIKCGNSLIDTDFFNSGQARNLTQEEINQINPFNYHEEFSAVLKAGGFDAVIGNPPYVDSELMSAQWPLERAYCTSHYDAASGNWDMFCVFIEKGVRLLKRNGFSSLIVPNKLGSTAYSTGARSVLANEGCLISVRDYSKVPVFLHGTKQSKVGVYPIVFLFQKTLRKADYQVGYERMSVKDNEIIKILEETLPFDAYFSPANQPWRIFSSIEANNPATTIGKRHQPLSDFADVTGAATVAEAYEIQKLISESAKDKVSDIKLVNSGTIDRYLFLWGKKQLRYLGDSYLRPIINKSVSISLPKERLKQALKPKIIVSGMTRNLECAADIEGNLLAGKSTTVIIPKQINLLYLLGLLNSQLINHYYNHTFGGDRLQGGYLRIGPPQIKTVPIRAIDFNDKTDKARHDKMVQLVETMLKLQEQLKTTTLDATRKSLERRIAATDQQIDALVYELYGLTKDEITLVEANAK